MATDQVDIKQLLEAGAHFGHQTSRWHPRMAPYIHSKREGNHIIDLTKTVEALDKALAFLSETAGAGKQVLLVSTKRQAKDKVKDVAVATNMPYVTERWLGGMLTNWNTMHARIQEMERLENLRDSGEINRLTKKEGLLIGREITRLNIRLDGVRSMKRLPDLIFIVDVSREYAAVHEANLLGIPIVALVDTNCNPQDIDYVIPSNDDAIRAIKLLVGKVAEAVLEGKSMRKDEEIAEEQAAAAAAGAAPAPAKKPARNVDMDVDETDEALLGKATLAKLAKTVEPENIKAVEPEVQAPAAVEVDTVVEAEAKPIKAAKAKADAEVEAPAKPAKATKAAKAETPAKPAKASKSETPADSEE